MLRPVFEVFEAELREQAPAVADALIQVADANDRGAREALLGEVYRYAHSMKGNAGTLGLEDLQALAHVMESLLQPHRSGEAPLDPEVARSLMAALDVCPPRVARALDGFEGEDEAVATATARLKSLLEGPGVSGGGRGRRRGTKSKKPASEVPPATPVLPDGNPPGRRAAERVAHEMMRVSVERLGRLDRILDDLRDARGSLDGRVEDLRRIYWLLEEAVAESGGEAPEALRTARDHVRDLLRGLGFELAEMGARLGSAEDELRQLRMLPVDTVLAPLPRAVWEHAHQTGKKAKLTTTGTEVALDRRILDELKDPLVHLVRNAVDHGLEPPEERARAGKPEEGALKVDVEQREGRVVLAVRDDGRGIHLDAVRAAAVKKGLLSREAALALDESSTLDLLFTPGFSTAAQVSLTSGRGVGLDVVRERLQKVGGKVTVQSEPGKGTTFHLEVPLTLATAQVLLVQAGAQRVGLPLAAVHSALFVPHRAGVPPQSVQVEGQPIPLDDLPTLLGISGRDQVRGGFPVVVLRDLERLVALRVDRLLGERELVLRPLPQELQRLRHLSSAASVGDGRIVFVLHPRALAERSASRERGAGAKARGERRRVLVADDSITTRSLHRQVLEAAGFEVETASDGEEAFRLLGGRPFDLVVSDVRMPRLDGVGLTERIRKEDRHRALPVVLVSSLDSDEDRERAAAAGASALVSKGGYERGELLRLIKELLPR